MSYMTKSEICAKDLVNSLLPYLPPSSSDLKDAYEACEYVAAAQGAIHDLGVLRSDIPEQLLNDIEKLLMLIETEDDASYYIRFLDSMKTGYKQLKDRWVYVNGNQSA